MNIHYKDEYITQLERIIALMPGNVYWKDKNGKYLGCNNKFAEILKIPCRNNIQGKDDFNILNKKLANFIFSNDQLVISQHTEQIFEEVGYDINGKSAIYLSKKTPLISKEGQVIGLFGISLKSR